MFRNIPSSIFKLFPSFLVNAWMEFPQHFIDNIEFHIRLDLIKSVFLEWMLKVGSKVGVQLTAVGTGARAQLLCIMPLMLEPIYTHTPALEGSLLGTMLKGGWRCFSLAADVSQKVWRSPSLGICQDYTGDFMGGFFSPSCISNVLLLGELARNKVCFWFSVVQIQPRAVQRLGGEAITPLGKANLGAALWLVHGLQMLLILSLFH